MFIVLLEFSENKRNASHWMKAHSEWIQRGFDDGVFLLVGSLLPTVGGAVVAHPTSREDLQRRVDADPFVVENVVKATILEVEPSKVDARLEFLRVRAL
jgi:uncharacterized protein YciI